MFPGSVIEDILRGSHSTTLDLWPRSVTDDASLGPDHPSSIRNEPVTLGKTILVPLDGSARTARILPEAFRMARDAGGQIILTTVLDLASTSVHRARDLEHAISRALEDRAKVIRDAGFPTKVDVIVSADVSGSLVTHACSTRAYLIAMTIHARGSVGKFVFGSVANWVASRAAHPVVFTRPFAGDVSCAALYQDVPASILNLASLPHEVSHP